MKNRQKQAVSLTKKKKMSKEMRYRLREGLFLIYIALASFLLIALLSYHATDPGWSSTGLGSHVANWGGRVGAWFADVALSFFGIIAYFFPAFILLACFLNWREMQREQEHAHDIFFTWLGWVLILLSLSALMSFRSIPSHYFPAQAGGVLGDVIAHLLLRLLSQTGSVLFFFTALLIGITLVSGFSWLKSAERVGEKCSQLFAYAFNYFSAKKTPEFKEEPRLNLTSIHKEPVIEVTEKPVISPPKLTLPPREVLVTKLETPREKKRIEVDKNIHLNPGSMPAFNLLSPPLPNAEKPFSDLSFDELSSLVEQRLADFGVDVRVAAVHPGPIITRFELDLAPGIKVSKITSLAKDIARSLSVVSVRIVEVIPGKSVIGLEIPNENREMVFLREILESKRYGDLRSPLALVLGKDTSGHPMVVDLAKMPHLLVAGTTGSGKSVSLNVMLLSMLFKATPNELRLIMIDPKMLELSVYDGIPHLLTPVITDMKDAANALRWCVAEMDKRYRLMASLGVRHLAGYNQKVSEAIKQGEPLGLPQALITDEHSAKIILEPLPFIVVIVDEFADMMMVVGKKVEDLIARIAQKARAAGIHLVLATQRPSVDVITGLIKANVPTRVAFQVSSRIDSRTILDQQGAEQLLGHGDMLYLPPGAGVPVRVHGAYVSDEEVHRVVAAWRSTGEPTYLHGVTEDVSDTANSENGASTGERDPLYDEAIKIVMDSRRASISLVQRRLRIGYNRAARLIEEMEAAGLVSTMDGNGTREVLVASNLQD